MKNPPATPLVDASTGRVIWRGHKWSAEGAYSTAVFDTQMEAHAWAMAPSKPKPIMRPV